MMELLVKTLNGDVKLLQARPSDTVGELKKLIFRVFNEPPHRQKLCTSNGTTITLDDDSRSLGSYGLGSGSEVILFITGPATFDLFVRNEKGQTHTYQVAPDETVLQFQNKVFNKERVPTDQQILIHNGRQLEPGRKLQDYDVAPGSTIYLTLRLRGG